MTTKVTARPTFCTQPMSTGTVIPTILGMVFWVFIQSAQVKAQDLFIAPLSPGSGNKDHQVEALEFTVPEEVDDVAACLGMIIGERAIAYVSSYGDQDILEDLRAPYYSYFAAVAINGLEEQEIVVTDSIVAGNSDMVINLANAGEFDIADQQRVVNCQHLISSYAIKNGALIESQGRFWDPAITENLSVIERILNTSIRN